MEFLNNKDVREARQYFVKRLKEDDKLSSLTVSHGDKNDWEDIFFFMSNRMLIIGSKLTSNIKYDDFFDITNIRFYYGLVNDVILVNGVIEFRSLVKLPLELELSNDKFKYPYQDRMRYKNSSKSTVYTQTINSAVKSAKDIADLAIETLQNLYRKGSK